MLLCLFIQRQLHICCVQLTRLETNPALGQISECFRDPIGAFGLPHPGLDVIKGIFDGDTSKVDYGFRRLLRYYFETVILSDVSTCDGFLGYYGPLLGI